MIKTFISSFIQFLKTVKFKWSWLAVKKYLIFLCSSWSAQSTDLISTLLRMSRYAKGDETRLKISDLNHTSCNCSPGGRQGELDQKHIWVRYKNSLYCLNSLDRKSKFHNSRDCHEMAGPLSTFSEVNQHYQKAFQHHTYCVANK